MRGRHRDVFLALAERAAPHLETGSPARVARSARSRGGQPGGSARVRACERAARSRCASARRSIAGGAPAVASPRRSWRIRAPWRLAGTGSPRCARGCSNVAPGWPPTRASTKSRKRTRRRRLRSPWRLRTRGPRRGRAARWVSLFCMRTRVRGERSSRAPPSSLGAAGDDWALVEAKQLIAVTCWIQHDHARSARVNEEVAALAERLGDPLQVGRRWFNPAWMAAIDGRFAEGRDAVERMRTAVDAGWGASHRGIGRPSGSQYRYLAGRARGRAQTPAKPARPRPEARRRTRPCRIS